MTSPVTVREAKKDDLPEVAKLAARLVRMHHALDPDRFMSFEPLEEGYAWWLGKELGNKDAVVVVAEMDTRIVGYAYGRNEERNWNDLLDAHGKLHDVFVDDAARRHGAATALVDEVVRRLAAMGAPRVILLTASKNTGAHRLFEGLGFRPTMIEMTRETDVAKKTS
jgi:ribosomal protein S18 acetylase RimI-like enzyme